MHKRIAIIGGAGFVGGHLASALKAEGYDVLVVDSLTINNLYSIWSERDNGNRGKHLRMIEERLAILDEARIPLQQLDARDYHILSHLLGLFKPQVIIHLAAIAHLSVARKSPFTTFDHSLRTLENALDVAVAIGVERFIFFSSSTVYGDFAEVPIREDSPLHPKGTYASLKSAGELMVKSYREDAGLPFTIFRPQALYGPRCVSGRVLQLFIENALEGIPLTVRGENEAIDFTHVSDVVRAVSLVIEKKEAEDETFNISAGNGRLISEAADLILRRFPEVAIVRTSREDERPKRGTMDISKARSILGYEPTIQLETGLDSYIDWYNGMWSKET